MLRILFILLMSFSVFAQDRPGAGDQPQTRVVSIIVSPEGYYPNSISLFEGDKVKFFVTSTTEAPDCFMVQDHPVFLAANKGKITEAESVFDKAGEYSFFCPSTKNNGKIVVMKKRSAIRDIASDKGKDPQMTWTPKEYD